MFFIVFNQNNIVNDGQNNKLVYKFPNSVSLKDKYVAVTSVSMFYSWFNISTLYANNSFSYTWTTGATTTTYSISIPDGLYNISDLNNLIQFNCIQNGTYWITSSGMFAYPFEFILNPQRYAVQISTYLIPSSLPTGATVPASFPGWPTIPQNSVVTIPTNLNIILGFSSILITDSNINNTYTPSSNYISKNTAGTISYISTIAPQVQPNSNLMITLSGVNNPYTQPSSIIYSISPSVAVGEQITLTPPNFAWDKFIEGTYNELRMTFLGTDLQPISIKDPNMTIILAIRDGNESFLGTK